MHERRAHIFVVGVHASARDARSVSVCVWRFVSGGGTHKNATYSYVLLGHPLGLGLETLLVLCPPALQSLFNQNTLYVTCVVAGSSCTDTASIILVIADPNNTTRMTI